jgi:hypothetical protein|tara:strand:+ start:267 stop:518 length:252 start_codon:yes stop_codon:yes gene_type:complete
MENKFSQAKQLAKIRGYRVLTNHQIQTMQQLCELPSLSVVDIVNELESAPEERVKQSVDSARRLLSSSLGKLSSKLQPAIHAS